MQPLLILICLIGPLSVSGQSCSYSYIPGPFNWKDGRDSCINDGMDLAVMKDQETLEEVKVYVATNGWTNDIWIGLLWNTTDLSFEWIDNEPLGLWTNWDSVEPDCMEKTSPLCNFYQNCVRIRSTSLWRTIDCTSLYPVLCQRCTGTTIASSLSSQTVESDYNTKLQTVQHASSSQTTTPTPNTSTIVESDYNTKLQTVQHASSTQTTPPTPNTSTIGTTIASSLSSQTAKSDYDTKLQTGHLASSTQTTPPTPNTSTIGTTIASSLSSQTAKSDYVTKLQTGHHASSTQTATLTLNTSTIGKDNCTSKSNGCQCRKRMSNTTESVKMSDYIWLRKCEVQPLIESGVLKVIDCPFTCSCSPRDTNEANSLKHEMFVCIKRR